METDEDLCRRVVAALRSGRSIRVVAGEFGLHPSRVARMRKKILRNGRYVMSKKETVGKRSKIVETVSGIPVLQNGNTRVNYKLEDNGRVRYQYRPQSHLGYAEFNSSHDLGTGLFVNRSAFSAMGKKIPSARTLRRDRQSRIGPVVRGKKNRKNWARGLQASQMLGV